MVIRPLDVERLKREFRDAEPYPHLKIDGFLDEDFAAEVAGAYPSFDEAGALGFKFEAVNEIGKIQITEAEKFPDPIARLNEALASEELLRQLAEISGIEVLVADEGLAGGGMHMTGPRGRLDVHVDFNFNERLKLHRRLNLLVYLNPIWEPTWGGGVELWDTAVQKRYGVFTPKLNRAVLFETSDHSFHGVEEVRCPAHLTRNSFAVYYYSPEPPPGYAGHDHSTIFRARPDEKLKKYVLMPAERAKRALAAGGRRARRAGKKLGLLDRE